MVSAYLNYTKHLNICLKLHSLLILSKNIEIWLQEFDKKTKLRLLENLMLVTGIWPVKTSNPFIATAYKLYYYLYESILAYFVITLVIYAPFVYRHGFTTIIDYAALTPLHVLTWLKRFSCQSKTVMNLLDEIQSKKSIISKSENENIQNIYINTCKSASKMKIAFTIVVVISYLTYAIFSSLYAIVFRSSDHVVSNNITTFCKNRPTPAISWKPFDVNNHYYFAFTLDLITPIFGMIYINLCYVLYIDLVTFVLCLLKTLQYCLENFQKYSLKFQYYYGIGPEEASYVTIRAIIIEHQYILT